MGTMTAKHSYGTPVAARDGFGSSHAPETARHSKPGSRRWAEARQKPAVARNVERVATRMRAPEYQRNVAVRLERHFPTVSVEWPVERGASDSMARDITQYAPRVDVAVGPFSVRPGRDKRIVRQLLPPEFLDRFVDLEPNRNPRCLLAIEVVFSGTSKRIMGDMLNASALGLYGVVVGQEPLMAMIERTWKYLTLLAELKKQPRLFCNVVPLSVHKFDDLLEALPHSRDSPPRAA
jgi:hypothetical protein